MNDQRLRALRRQAAGGDGEARAKLLAERVRCGDLRAEALRSAALLGDGAASAASGTPLPRPTEDFDTWLARLESGGRRLLVQAGLVAARVVLPEWEREHPNDPSLVEGLQAAEERFEGAEVDRYQAAERTRALARLVHDDPAAEAWAVLAAELGPEESPDPGAVVELTIRLRAARAAARATWRVRRLVDLWEEGASRFTLEARAREVLIDAAIAWVETPRLLERVSTQLREQLLAPD